MKRFFVFLWALIMSTLIVGCGNNITQPLQEQKEKVNVADYFFEMDREDVNLNFEIQECEYATSGYTDNVSSLKAVAHGTSEEIQQLVDNMKKAGYEFTDGDYFKKSEKGTHCEKSYLIYYDPKYDVHYDSKKEKKSREIIPIDMYVNINEDSVEIGYFSTLGTTPYFFINPNHVISKKTDLGYGEEADIVYFTSSTEESGKYDICVFFSQDDIIVKLVTIEGNAEEIRDAVTVSKPENGKILYHQNKTSKEDEKNVMFVLDSEKGYVKEN